MDSLFDPSEPVGGALEVCFEHSVPLFEAFVGSVLLLKAHYSLLEQLELMCVHLLQRRLLYESTHHLYVAADHRYIAAEGTTARAFDHLLARQPRVPPTIAKVIPSIFWQQTLNVRH